ncbi:MAG: glycosyltransferase [Solirubrobacterales bacterium]|nr:glycosyltransferase [Solirubrobacterales bacterium]
MVPAAGGPGAIPVLLHAEALGLGERHQLTLVTAVGDEPWEAEAAAVLLDSGLDVHLADRRQPVRSRARWRRRLRLAGAWAGGRTPWRTVWFADPALQEILNRLTATREFDVIAVEDSAMSGFRLPQGVPTVYTHHEVLKPRPIARPPGAPRSWPGWLRGEIDWRRWGGFQKAAWRRFDLTQVFSRRDSEAIAESVPDAAARIRVNPFGIVLPDRADRSREVPGTMLFVGNFAHPPNRDAAIWLAREIVPAVVARCPAARLRVVGAAPPAEVLALAGEHVEVFADAPSVRPHLERAALVLAPVRTGGGMRMKVLEAVATGKAVVTTARGAEGFTAFSEEPPLAIADDAAGIAAAAADLLGDDPGRAALAARARAFAELHHSPEAWAERLTAVFEEAIAIGDRRADG